MPILWVTLIADSLTLAVTIYAAARRPLLLDFFIVGFAMCTFAAALHQVLASDTHLFILGFTVVINLLLTYRLSKLRDRRSSDAKS